MRGVKNGNSRMLRQHQFMAKRGCHHIQETLTVRLTWWQVIPGDWDRICLSRM